MKDFTDSTKMPFGKYGPDGEQKILGDIPADYLLWLWDNGVFLEDRETGSNEWNHGLHKYISVAWDDLVEESKYIPKHQKKSI